MNHINGAKVEIGQGNRRCQVWTQGVPDIKYEPHKSFGVLLADLVVGKKKIEDGVVWPGVRVPAVSTTERGLLMPRLSRTRRSSSYWAAPSRRARTRSNRATARRWVTRSVGHARDRRPGAPWRRTTHRERAVQLYKR